MVNFKKKTVAPERVALVETAAATAVIAGNPRGPTTQANSELPYVSAPSQAVPREVGSRQDSLRDYQVGFVYAIPVGEIRSNPFNPRAVYTSSAVDDMASSMASGGQRVSATAYVNPQGEVVLIEG